MVERILIVGVGNLGKRHLQSLVRLKNRSFWVVDISEKNLKQAKDLIQAEDVVDIEISYSTKLNTLLKV